jgi:hypothetical protein
MRRGTVLATLGAALALLCSLTACGGSSLKPAQAPVSRSSSASSSTASRGAANSYPDVQSLIAAMAVAGAPCSDVSLSSGSTESGALSTYAECSGSSSGDTAIVIFKDHASAAAYAGRMLSVGQSLGDPAAEVVGPDWTVNTVPAFADKVVKAVGGQLMKESSNVSGASSAPRPSAPAAPTMTRQTDRVVFRVSGSGYPVPCQNSFMGAELAFHARYAALRYSVIRPVVRL